MRVLALLALLAAAACTVVRVGGGDCIERLELDLGGLHIDWCSQPAPEPEAT